PPPSTATVPYFSISEGLPSGPTTSSIAWPFSSSFNSYVVFPTACTTIWIVPFSRSELSIVIGMRSPLSCNRSITNWPAWCFFAIRGTSITNRLIPGAMNCASKILYMPACSPSWVFPHHLLHRSSQFHCTTNSSRRHRLVHHSQRRQYLRPLRAAQRQPDAFRRRDQRALPTCLQVRQRRFHFRPHAPCGKLPAHQVLMRFCPAHMKQRPRVVLPVVQVHMLHAGRKQQQLRLQIPRQQRRAPVFINHRLAPAQPPRAPHHRNSSAARRNHHKPSVQAGPDRFNFINPSRMRRSHDSSPASPRIFHHFPAKLVAPLFRLVFPVTRPDWFVWTQKRRIVGIHDYLRNQAHNLLWHSFFVQRVVQRLLQQVAHRSFGLCPTHVQMLWPSRPVCSFRSQQRFAHLRAVSVRHHYAVALLQHRADSFARFLRVRLLLFKRAALVFPRQRVPAYRNHRNRFHRPSRILLISLNDPARLLKRSFSLGGRGFSPGVMPR